MSLKLTFLVVHINLVNNIKTVCAFTSKFNTKLNVFTVEQWLQLDISKMVSTDFFHMPGEVAVNLEDIVEKSIRKIAACFFQP